MVKPVRRRSAHHWQQPQFLYIREKNKVRKMHSTPSFGVQMPVTAFRSRTNERLPPNKHSNARTPGPVGPSPGVLSVRRVSTDLLLSITLKVQPRILQYALFQKQGNTTDAQAFHQLGKQEFRFCLAGTTEFFGSFFNEVPGHNLLLIAAVP